MNRTTRNTIIAICCSGMFAAVGCQSSGELSVTGMYSNQGQALSGDECDQLLLDAANAGSADEQDAAQAEFRECVEQTLGENGQHAECRDDDDNTCDIILEEIGDTIERLHQEGSGDLRPECDNAGGAGAEAALCHLMAAYEACELDNDDDGNPDVEPCDDSNAADGRCEPPPRCDADSPDGNCEPPPHCDEAGANGDTDPACHPQLPPECRDGNMPEDEWNAVCNPNEPPRCDADNPDSWADGQCEPGGTDPNEPNCEEIRDFASQAGDQDREFLERERPECFDPNGEPGTEPGTEPGDGTNSDEQFCQDLLEQIQNAPDDQESAALREVFERECTNG